MPLTGVSSLGLSTMVQPAASAGKTLSAIWLIGQFHGVISPQTPMGSWRSTMRPRSSSKGKPLSTRMVSSRCCAPAATWASRDSDSGAPISEVTASTRSS